MTVECQNTERLSHQIVALEQQVAAMASLYVATHRLYGSLDRQQILGTMLEILANFIGTEEFAVLELDEKGQSLHLTASMGIDPSLWQNVPLESGLIHRTVVNGTPYLEWESNDEGALPSEENLQVCIPLKVRGRVTGVIAILGWLQHKDRFERLDREVLDLLGTHAATALFCADLLKKAVQSGEVKL